MTATLTGQTLTDAGTFATPARRVYVIEDPGYGDVLVAPVTDESDPSVISIDNDAAMWVSRDQVS